MKKIILLILIFALSNIFASINTRVVSVSNTYNTPSAGLGTLILDVEAISDAGNVDLNAFQNALQLDAIFQAQNPSVVFSDQLFPSPNYNVLETLTGDGRIQHQYTFNFAGPRGTVSGSSWTKVVRVTIQYTMADVNGEISWSGGLPNFFATDASNVEITGTEETIPAALQSVPLPVELSSFSATNQKGNIVNLQWETATEVNNYGFEVERSIKVEDTEEVEWNKISFVEGSGNSNSQKLYSFVDKNPVGGTKFAYRLKQIDIDGTFEYSDLVEIEVLPSEYELYQNYPNPFNPSTKIKFSLPEDAKVAVDIYNMLGQRVMTLFNKDMKAGYHQVLFDTQSAGNQLASGIYIYTISTKNFSSVKKMVLLK